jgi:hypothetical protein
MSTALFIRLITFRTALPHLIFVIAIEVTQSYQIHNLSMKEQRPKVLLGLFQISGARLPKSLETLEVCLKCYL